MIPNHKHNLTKFAVISDILLSIAEMYCFPIYFSTHIDIYCLPIYNIVKQDILVANIERGGYNGK